MNARRGVFQHGSLLTVCGIVFVLIACATEMRVDHTVALRTGTPAKITDVTLVYGDMRPIHLPALGMGGGSWTRTMTVPEAATVTWSTEDGRKHEVSAPIRAKLPFSMAGNRVSFEIHGDKLKVFADKRLRDFKSERTQIYGN